MLNAILIVIQLIVSLILIVFILLHSGRGGGLSDMFGGVSGSSMAGSTVVEIKGSHAIYVSQPQPVASLIETAASA